MYGGESFRFVTNSYLSISPEYKKFGFGIVLWSELAKRIRTAGFDGMLNFCVVGEPMDKMIEGCCRRLRLSAERVFSVRYISSVLQPSNDHYHSGDLPATCVTDFVELASAVTRSQPLAREWTSEEAEWQCVHRTNVVTAHLRAGTRRGILTGYIMSISDAVRTKCLLVEDILWNELEIPERLNCCDVFFLRLLRPELGWPPFLFLATLTMVPLRNFDFFRPAVFCTVT